MSDSIWKTPDQKPDNDNDIVCLVGALPFAGYYEKFNASYVEHATGENYMPDEIDRWCYLDDLIAQADKAERLQKAVDLIANMEQRLCIDDPVDILDDVLKIAKDEIKQLIKGE